MSPAALRQRQEASRQHGLYAQPPKPGPQTQAGQVTPWERRKRHTRPRVNSLLEKYPLLAGQPRVQLEHYVELELAKSTLFNQLQAGMDVGASYIRAVAFWETAARRLGILSEVAPTAAGAAPSIAAGAVNYFNRAEVLQLVRAMQAAEEFRAPTAADVRGEGG